MAWAEGGRLWKGCGQIGAERGRLAEAWRVGRLGSFACVTILSPPPEALWGEGPFRYRRDVAQVQRF